MAKRKSTGKTRKKQPENQDVPGPQSGEGAEHAAAAPRVKEDGDGNEGDFIPFSLEKTVIAVPLFNDFDAKRPTSQSTPEPLHSVIIDINLLYYAGREKAKRRVQQLIVEILKDKQFTRKAGAQQGINPVKTRFSQQYVFAVLEEGVIKELVKRDAQAGNPGGDETASWKAIYHIWPDFEIKKLTTKTVSTVKADAARNAFSAFGENIYWAVMDSGIDGTHPHFNAQQNLAMPADPDPLQHRDFTILSTELSVKEEDITREIDMKPDPNERPLEDEYGHGTHVAGIIAGELDNAGGQQIIATTAHRDENRNLTRNTAPINSRITGMAPRCKLISLKVLDRAGKGEASNLIAAIQWIQEINGYGRRIRIHGVNMSVGYEFEPEWFACGQSPLCVEVDRLVKTGVVVVVAAGNTGYGFVQAKLKSGAVTAGIDLTINDPGNADLAITVGSTHREMPHIYGVSYFSSKGPTGDGRLKPDLVAPGEKVISCDSAQRRQRDPNAASAPATAGGDGAVSPQPGYYRENSGTSMAAPHVSGVIAAFLSVRREFIGKPETIKQIFLSTATDLKRERYFQGHGLVDLMRAIQSV
jgi:subtilisin family serine protease